MRYLMLAALLLAGPSQAQSVDSTPFNCEQIKGTTLAAVQMWQMRVACRSLEASHLRSFAKLQGKPRPSKTVVKLPAYGTAAGTEVGLVCMGGQAMRQLPRGWEQIRDVDGNWQRCQPL
jgi:hypothetical protein